MGIEFTIDVNAGVIYTVAEGDTSSSDLQAFREQLVAHPAYNTNLDHLFDGCNARLDFTGEEARNLASWSVKKNRSSGPRLCLANMGLLLAVCSKDGLEIPTP